MGKLWKLGFASQPVLRGHVVTLKHMCVLLNGVTSWRWSKLKNLNRKFHTDAYLELGFTYSIFCVGKNKRQVWGILIYPKLYIYKWTFSGTFICFLINLFIFWKCYGHIGDLVAKKGHFVHNFMKCWKRKTTGIKHGKESKDYVENFHSFYFSPRFMSILKNYK